MALNTTGGTEGRRDVPPVESPGAEAAPRAGAGSGRWEEGAWGAPITCPLALPRRAPCAVRSAPPTPVPSAPPRAGLPLPHRVHDPSLLLLPPLQQTARDS